jgi:hypothetical protein
LKDFREQRCAADESRIGTSFKENRDDFDVRLNNLVLSYARGVDEEKERQTGTAN